MHQGCLGEPLHGQVHLDLLHGGAGRAQRLREARVLASTSGSTGKSPRTPPRDPQTVHLAEVAGDPLRRQGHVVDGVLPLDHVVEQGRVGHGAGHGPVVAVGVEVEGGSAGTRPYGALNPTTPQKDDGIRMEPPMSEPLARYAVPAASAAPEPPEEPPGVKSGFHGLRVTPHSRCG